MIRSIGARLPLGFLVLLVCGVSPALAGDETLLRLNLKKGDFHRFSMSLEQQMTMNQGAMGSQQSENTMDVEFAFHVADVAEDGTLTIETTYERVSVLVRAMGNEVSYDTADGKSEDAGNPLAMLDRLIDQKFSFEASSQGRVLEVRGFETLFEEMRSSLSPEPGASKVIGLVEAVFNEDALKTRLQQALVIFPEEPVGAGDDWTTDLQSTTPALGAIDTRATLVVRGAETRRERKCIELGVSMNMNIADDSPLMQQLRDSFAPQGMDAKLDWELGEVSSSGTMWIDSETGLTVDSDLDQVMHATFTLAMGTGAEAVTLDMQMDLDQNIRVELLD
jgi:hypothetical protein